MKGRHFGVILQEEFEAAGTSASALFDTQALPGGPRRSYALRNRRKPYPSFCQILVVATQGIQTGRNTGRFSFCMIED